MSKKKKIILLTIILIAIIMSFIIPVKVDMEYEFGDRNIKNKFDIRSMDCTIHKYKNIYGITIKTTKSIGIQIIN